MSDVVRQAAMMVALLSTAVGLLAFARSLFVCSNKLMGGVVSAFGGLYLLGFGVLLFIFIQRIWNHG